MPNLSQRLSVRAGAPQLSDGRVTFSVEVSGDEKLFATSLFLEANKAIEPLVEHLKRTIRGEVLSHLKAAQDALRGLRVMPGSPENGTRRKTRTASPSLGSPPKPAQPSLIEPHTPEAPLGVRRGA